MAYLTVKSRPPGLSRGVSFTQAAGTSADASSGVALVPAKADHIAVVDALMVSSTAAEIFTLLAGSDVLMSEKHTAAHGEPVDCIPADQCIRSDTIGEAISIKTATSGAVFWDVWYHYERAPDGA
jgi:hypothetical protein